MRPPKDRDFVETADGLIWCSVGYLHPHDRYTAYLKYTPAETRRWRDPARTPLIPAFSPAGRREG